MPYLASVEVNKLWLIEFSIKIHYFKAETKDMRTIQHEELQQVTEVDFESDEDEALIDSSRLGNSSPKKPEKNSGPLEIYSKLRTLLFWLLFIFNGVKTSISFFREKLVFTSDNEFQILESVKMNSRFSTELGFEKI